jgi:HSP20 family protein
MAGTQRALEPAQVRIVEPRAMLDRINKLSEQISRHAYEIFEKRGQAFGRDLEDWFAAESEILRPSQLRMEETDGALAIEVQTLKFSAKELEVSLEPWRLTISGNRETNVEQKKSKTTFQEQSTDQLLRVIDLSAEIDSTKATAMLKNGVLEIKLPKLMQAITTGVDLNAA